MQLIITSEHDVHEPAPIEIPLRGRTVPSGPLLLRGIDSPDAYPAQVSGDTLVALVANCEAARPARFVVEAGGGAGEVRLDKEGEHGLKITVPQGHFTTYNFDPAIARPFFYPVLGPGGKAVTRNFPMKNIEGEAHDHKHHRSFWSAYGKVNGVDDWSEEPNHGFIKHQKFTKKEEGSAFAGFTATAVWTSKDGKPLLDETRSIRVYNAGADRRLLDYSLTLAANYEDLHYGDTKEGGLLAFRVATSMDGNKGGRIENSIGGVTEKQVWGKRAPWLDYSGTVAGEILGIGMMDHPGNAQHPCYWHARDYGLVGTNPFAKGAFEGGAKTGYHQKKGDTLRFRYRVLIHKGDAKVGKVDEAYHAWIQAPQVRVI